MKFFKMLWLPLCLSLSVLTVSAQSVKEYDASSFGISNDGVTLNTRAIQYAIDYVSAHGGGLLRFTPGNYLSGSIYLKSNVTLNLEAGATLLGSTNPLDYVKDQNIQWTALVFAYQQENIGIIGAGTITCQGYTTATNLVNLVHLGLYNDPLKYDRANESLRPSNVYFRECKNITIKGVTLKDPASWNQVYELCNNLVIDHETVRATSYWNNDGLDVVDCQNVKITHCDIDAADDAYCFKSHHSDGISDNILVDSCIGRSSANGIKFGTVSKGTFRNVKLTNMTIYDTYRSAVTLAAVDGANVENFEIDGLRSINTGNVIYLRTGHRRNLEKVASMKNVTIKNVYAEVPLTKADAGYVYEGPVEDLPRNISPSSIVGQPDIMIENVTMENIEIVYPGAGNPHYAYRGTSKAELDSIPEQPAKYPEFSQFKELPAWGFYVRHARGVTMKNVKISAKASDYRPAFVFDDATGVNFEKVQVVEPASKGKKQVIMNNAKGNVKLVK